ncbi:VWA domain-containing protein [Algicella marina]|uniref:VWA domain-containing protein n=1 Tax=Algicella marina TaxID=2683284 RepID=A0A6P1T7G0_9RHOB|nr:VWA domain-containing protein [Algicella marina]QHQ36512.1 VWA domain-containing protein [Algicella marina]
MPELADPWALLLLPLPLLAWFLLAPRPAEGALLTVPEGVARSILGQSRAEGRARSANLLLPIAIWVLLVTAISGPRLLQPSGALPMSGRDLVIALDLSGSMVREDFELDGETASRLDVVRTVGADFIRRRGGDRVGLVVFGSEAYFASPLTFDVESVARTVEEAVIGVSGRATNISDALGIALKRLSVSEAESRVVILLSDGASNAGAATPRDVAKLAAELGVRVHTIAFGPKSVEESPNERGVVDATTLQSMADLSGGTMFRVRTSDDLVAVTQDLDRLESTESAGLSAAIYHDLWIYPAILAGLGCLLLGWRERA